MLIADFKFVPFEQGMFDAQEQGALFVFIHSTSGAHYACRYWDAARFKGKESYPMALQNHLIKQPSDVDVFTMVVNNRMRKSGEAAMNKVVDWLKENNLYRRQHYPGPHKAANSIDTVRHQVAKFKHGPTGAVFIGGVVEGRNPQNSLNGRVIDFNHAYKSVDKKSDVLTLFAQAHFPLQPHDWSVELVCEESLNHLQLTQKIEELSIAALRSGEFVVSRIRTHSPLWYFNNLYRGKNITAEQYVALGSAGNLAKNRNLQSSERA